MDTAHYWRHPAVPGVDLMRAHYVRHGFARHAHDTFAIGTVRSGAEDMLIGAETHRIGAGGVVLLNPETVHDGHPAAVDGVRYRVFYPEVAVVAEAVGNRRPWFTDPVVHDPAAEAAIVEAHRAAEAGDRLTSGTLLVELLSLLGHRHGGGVRRVAPASGGQAVAAARDILHERLVDPPSLRELAAAVGTGQYALVRAFRTRFGLPPHAYLTQLRVRAARVLLDAGEPLAQVALAVGFTDQPHLSRHFRRVVGVAPGHYRRKNVQDRRGGAP